MEPSIIVGIVVLIVGVVAVVVSFFMADAKSKSVDELAEDGKADIERQLSEYCDSLVEKKKKELSGQREKAKSDMKKGFDDALTESGKDYDKLKSDSKKDFDDLKSASQKEMDEFIEKAAKQFDEMKSDTQKKLDDMHENSTARVEAALKSYENSLTAAKAKMEKELEACSTQLSEKAKKQMIDYINKSLSEAYEAYDPDDRSEKEPITYDEPEKIEDAGVADDTAGAEANDKIIAEAADNTDDSQSAEKKVETDGVIDSAFPVVADDNADSRDDNTQAENDTQGAAKAQVGGNTQAKDGAQEGGSAHTAEDRPKNNRSKKKKKRKPEQKKTIDIWDEGVDTDTRVAELHKKGFSIMEIANRLGLGVGEVKTTIDRIEKKAAADAANKTEDTDKNGESN